MTPTLWLTQLDRLIEAGTVAMRARAIAKLVKPLETKLAIIFRRQGEAFVKGFGRLHPLFREALTESSWLSVFEEASGVTRSLFFAAVQESAKAALLAGARDTISSIGLDFAFNLDHPQAVAYLQQHGYSLISQIDEVTRQRIGQIITTGTTEGWSYDRMAGEITRQYSEMAVGKPQEHIQSRAHLIAITEMGEAYEHASLTAVQDLATAGIPMEKSWLTVGDKRVSDGCLENARAGWIPLVQPFPSGHQRPLRFPGCRCTALYQRKRRD